MSEPINIPGARNRNSIGSNSSTSGSYRTGSPPYYNISPPKIKTNNIEVYKSIKQHKDKNPDKVYNMSDFFQQLATDSYVLNIKKEKFQTLKSPKTINGKEYNYRINFTINRNWLSLYTDFILFNAEQAERVAVTCNEKPIFEKEFPYSAETVGFFMSRPNVLPMLSLPLLTFQMSIYVGATNGKTKLIFTEIKVKPEVQSIICMLDKWYVINDGKRIFFGEEYPSEKCIDNVWEELNLLPEIRKLNLCNM